MTGTNPSGGGIDSPSAFEAELESLIETAVENDVDPRGAWELEPQPADFDLEVTVFELDPSG